MDILWEKVESPEESPLILHPEKYATGKGTRSVRAQVEGDHEVLNSD